MSCPVICSFLLLAVCSISSEYLFADDPEGDYFSALQEISPAYYMRHRRSKERMCGEVLMRKLQAVCNDCVKPVGTQVFEKRSGIWRSKREDKVTEKCCRESCSIDYLKRFCCDK